MKPLTFRSQIARSSHFPLLIAQQLADLNWAIQQAKASADVELSTSTERTIRAQLNSKLEGNAEREYRRQLIAFEEAGGDEDDFEDPFDLEYTEFGRERRLYRRYLGEARAQRRKALKAWCAFNRHENQNSRNKFNLQS